MHKTVKRFTLVELLIVIAILGILVSLLMPSLSKAKDAAKLAIDLSNQRQVYTAMITYASRSNQKLIVPRDTLNPGKPWNSYVAGGGNFPLNPEGVGRLYTENYITDHRIFYCTSFSGQEKLADHTRSDGKWQASGNRVRMGQNINALHYKKLSELNHAVKSDQYFHQTVPEDTFKKDPSHAPLIYDQISQSPGNSETWHDNKWPLTTLDGSGKIYISTPLYNLIKSDTTNFNTKMPNHSLALYMLLGDY